MIKSLQQAKRFLTILFGFTLLILGVLMLALPGPGLLTIVFGLGILAAEYVWARRLLDRVKHHGGRLRNSIFQRDPSGSPSARPNPSSAETPSASSASSSTSPASPAPSPQLVVSVVAGDAVTQTTVVALDAPPPAAPEPQTTH